MNAPAEIQALHDAYIAASGNELRMNYLYAQAWTEYLSAGWTREDLLLVIQFTRRKMARGEGGFNPQSLMLRVLCADGWLKFDERLSMARTEQRRREPKPRTEQAVQRVGDIRRAVEQPAGLEPTGMPEVVKATMKDFRARMRGPSGQPSK